MSENIIGHMIFDFLNIESLTVAERLVCDGIKPQKVTDKCFVAVIRVFVPAHYVRTGLLLKGHSNLESLRMNEIVRVKIYDEFTSCILQTNIPCVTQSAIRFIYHPDSGICGSISFQNSLA